MYVQIVSLNGTVAEHRALWDHRINSRFLMCHHSSPCRPSLVSLSLLACLAPPGTQYSRDTYCLLCVSGPLLSTFNTSSPICLLTSSSFFKDQLRYLFSKLCQTHKVKLSSVGSHILCAYLFIQQIFVEFLFCFLLGSGDTIVNKIYKDLPFM